MCSSKLLILLIVSVWSFLALAGEAKPDIAKEINELPTDTNKETYERLFQDFTATGRDIKEIKYGIYNAVNNGYYEMIPIIESEVLPYQKNVESLIDYYLGIGIAIGALCERPSKAIDYISKGIDLAEKNNLTKQLFTSFDGNLNHAWAHIAVNYDRLNDPKNAAESYLKAGREIKKYYPIKTKTLNEFLSLSSYMILSFSAKST